MSWVRVPHRVPGVDWFRPCLNRLWWRRHGTRVRIPPTPPASAHWSDWPPSKRYKAGSNPAGGSTAAAKAEGAESPRSRPNKRGQQSAGMPQRSPVAQWTERPPPKRRWSRVRIPSGLPSRCRVTSCGSTPQPATNLRATGQACAGSSCGSRKASYHRGTRGKSARRLDNVPVLNKAGRRE